MTNTPNSVSTDIEFGSNKPGPTNEYGVSDEMLRRDQPFLVVHKDNEEGGILIGRESGHIYTSSFDRPEWAAQFHNALLGEWTTFYKDRFGEAYMLLHKQPAVFNFDDLGWIGMGEEGEEIEEPANMDYRLGVVQAVLIDAGIIQATDTVDLSEYRHGDDLTSIGIDLDLDRERTPEQAAALDRAATSGFAPMKTGTKD